MTNVGKLRHLETTRLDRVRLEALVSDLGEPGAERLVGRALDTIAVRLNRCERAWRVGDLERLVGSAEDLTSCAERIGLQTLERVAHDVIASAKAGHQPALAATLARLVRIGESSLMSAWDISDLSV